MIHSYKRGNDPIIKYAKGVKFLNKKIVFKEGVNVIVGPNGTGKSALLRALKTLFLAEQQGYTKINGTPDLGRLYGILGKGVFSDKVEHDGLPIVCDKTYETGYFDDDNFMESASSILKQKNSSTGESSKHHILMINAHTAKLKKVGNIVKEFKKRCANSNSYQKYADKWFDWFESGLVQTKEKYLTTILDEPTTGFDFKSKLEFWKNVFASEHIQLIVATHDVIPIFNEKSNIIETEKGYFSFVKERAKEIFI